MNKEKLEQIAEEYADKFNNFGGTYHGDVIRHIRIEAFKEALNLPEVKAMKEALEYYSDGYVFDEPDDDTEQLDISKIWRHTSGKRARKALADLEGVIGHG